MYLRNRVKRITYRNAAALRKRPTESEKALRKHLYAASKGKYIWKFNDIAAGYILDFYCPAVRVAVEVDGSSHDDKQQHDERRDFILRSRFKIVTLRFTVAEVMASPAAIVEKILRFCDSCERVTRSRKPKGNAL